MQHNMAVASMRRAQAEDRRKHAYSGLQRACKLRLKLSAYLSSFRGNVCILQQRPYKAESERIAATYIFAQLPQGMLLNGSTTAVVPQSIHGSLCIKLIKVKLCAIWECRPEGPAAGADELERLACPTQLLHQTSKLLHMQPQQAMKRSCLIQQPPDVPA